VGKNGHAAKGTAMKGPGNGAQELGLAMYRLRLSHGLSLRVLARRIGMSSHGGLAEYEKGRRIPAEDLVAAYERILGVRDCHLQELRKRALAEAAIAKVRSRLISLQPPASTPIAQLPADIADFAGRDDETKELHGLSGGIVVISGTPGVGKTALAVHVAHLMADEYPDAHLYCDLAGVPYPADPADVLARILRTLGTAESRIPAEIEERSLLCRSLLHARRTLLILDNAADEAQVRPLLPGSHQCLTFITSRSRLAGLAGVHRLNLDVPELEVALRMLAGAIGPERVDAEPEAAAELVEACGRLPLAIRIAGNRLAAWPSWTLTHLASRLGDEGERLDWLKAGDLDVRSALAPSYNALTGGCARLYRRLAVVPGPDFGQDLAAMLAGVSMPDAQMLLEQLVAVSLIQPARLPGRYRLHDLLRLYARDRLQAEEAPRLAEITATMADYLIQTAVRVSAALVPPGHTERPPEAGPAPDIQWLDAELPNVLDAAGMAADGCIFRLLKYLVWYLDRRCAWRELRQLSELACGAAPDLASSALAWNWLGLAFCGMGQFTQAAQCHERAADLARAAGDVREEGNAADRLGVALQGIGRSAEAVPYHERSVEIGQRLGDRWGQATALNHLGHALCCAGRPAEAIDCHRQALGIFRELGDVRGMAMAADALGATLSDLARFTEARQCHEQALMNFDVVGDDRGVALARRGIGVALHGLGRPGAAADQLRQAHATFRAMDDRLWAARTLRSLGEVLASIGSQDIAKAYWQEALSRFTDLHTPEVEQVRRLLGGPALL
jgi:tetratricopeptide (TPR) repeat protein/transcriptional regulator with XRE-family HTH domain